MTVVPNEGASRDREEYHSAHNGKEHTMMDKFNFVTLIEAAEFASTHEAVGVHTETRAGFTLYFVTMRPRPRMVKFHDCIAIADYHC